MNGVHHLFANEVVVPQWYCESETEASAAQASLTRESKAPPSVPTRYGGSTQGRDGGSSGTARLAGAVAGDPCGMESSGEYWKPVYWMLEDGFQTILGNAAHIKKAPGARPMPRTEAGSHSC